MKLYDDLRKLREARGLTQARAAELAGQGLRTWIRAEQGERLSKGQLGIMLGVLGGQISVIGGLHPQASCALRDLIPYLDGEQLRLLERELFGVEICVFSA